MDAEKYLVAKHSPDDLRQLQKVTESIIKWKKDKDIELERQAMSPFSPNSITLNGNATPIQMYDAMRSGHISADEFYAKTDKFYSNKYGAGYISTIKGSHLQ